MKKLFASKRLLLGCGFLGFCLLLAIAWPIFVFWHRPRTVTFDVGQVYPISANDEKVSRLDKMSDYLVVLEGPCADMPGCPDGLCGCRGGILGSKDLAELRRFLPREMKNYNQEATAIIWDYDIKPTKIRRRNNMFGEDEVTIEGQEEKGQTVYLTVVPKSLVAGNLNWVYVDLPPQSGINMKQKTLLTTMLLGGAMAGMLVGLAATRLTPAVKAATPAAAVGAMAELFAGKTYPLTLKADQINTSYHLVFLVDAQGRPSQYATRGETVAAGGETFLVCYDVPIAAAKTHPPQPKAGETGQLIYINIHAVQAIGGIISILPTDTATPIAPTP